ncbi:hypothetical protein AGMMS50239_25520 [Bacteroidia bacterium]|nr:hypothetical protein AGMMS50239_25520 [Bacteroidia bacterium]GHV29705.1 hypothetical protein FACS1894177_01030 [Bacteroidia bacterium]
MRKILKYLCGLLGLLTGCSIGDTHLIDKYYLVTIDVDEDLSVSYKLESGSYLGVVNPTVFAVGFNDDFIIVKQHPTNFGDTINRSITDYYIIPINNKVNKWPDENKIGPLTHEEFLIKRKELKIPDELDFSTVLKKLE